MLKQILFLTLIANVLFSVAYAMEPEEPGHLHSHYPKDQPEPCYEETQKNLPIKDLYCRLNGKLDESIGKIEALFYQKCVNRLAIYRGEPQGDDLNCGLPKEIAQPFLELCRQLTKRVKNKVHQTCVIQAAASLNKAQVAILLERKGNSNNPYLTMWHCLVSEANPDQNHYKVIPLLPHIQESNIDELLRINALLEDMNGEQLFELVKIFTTLPEKDHFCSVENCQRIFKQHPHMSVEEKLRFLRRLGKVKSEELEIFLKAAEKGNFNDNVVVGTETFHWVE